MKKLFSLLLVVVLLATAIVGLSSCGAEKDPSKIPDICEYAEEGIYEIALVTDVGTITDESFNQGAWEGVKLFANSKKITYAYYRPAEDNDTARLAAIASAITNGAKIVVCPGFLFETTIYTAQTQYPNVKFVLLDGEPHTADYATYKTESNVHCILYKEEQAGFLAGYAAVMDGYRKLGFLGGMSVPAVIRFGYGFVQGAEAAAKELNLTAGDVEVKYTYGGQFFGDAVITTAMQGWYSAGTEVVFACGGGIYTSALEACGANGKVIGVDVDQGGLDEKIITSAMKGLRESVQITLGKFYDDKWEEIGGTTIKLGAAEDCVGLPTVEAHWRLENFTVKQYNTVFNKLVDGTIAVNDGTDAMPVTELVTVTRVPDLK